MLGVSVRRSSSGRADGDVAALTGPTTPKVGHLSCDELGVRKGLEIALELTRIALWAASLYK